MNKLLSLIVPTYNMEKYLNKCLTSVTQNVPNSLEVLVVNDGSKDNSLSIAKEYEHNYPEIVKVIDKENGNYGSCFNRGLEESTGKYVRLLDADDSLVTDSLCKILDILEYIDDDVVVAGYNRVNEQGKVSLVVKNTYFESGRTYNVDDVLLEKSPDRGFFYTMHNVIYKTSVLKENKLTLQEGISYTDTEYCFYPWSYVQTIRFVDLVLYNYLVGRNGQTISDSSYVKNKGHLLKIIHRAIDSGCLNVKRSARVENQETIILNALKMYYKVVLMLEGKTEENESSLKYLDSQMTPELIKKTNSITFFKWFRIVAKWRNSSRWSHTFIMSVMNDLSKKLL